MGGLGGLIAAILTDEAGREAARVRKAAISYLWVGITVVCGIGFLIGAAYIYTARRFGNLDTALGFAAFFLVVAVISFFGHGIAARRRARLAAERRRAETRSIAGATALAVLPSLLSRGGGFGAVLAPAVAVLAYMIYRENSRPASGEGDLPPED